MANYAIEQIETWIFQANPKKYDIVGALSDPNLNLSWQVLRYNDKIKASHNAIVWMAGEEAGIYAIGFVTSKPRIASEDPIDNSYWIDLDQKEQTSYRVGIQITHNLLANPILRGSLLAMPELKGLSILKFAQGTNFPVMDDEWEAIKGLVDKVS
jgi:hypothetical protein